MPAAKRSAPVESTAKPLMGGINPRRERGERGEAGRPAVVAEMTQMGPLYYRRARNARRRGHGEDRCLRVLHVAIAAVVLVALLVASPLRAAEAINVPVDAPAIDLTDAVDRLTTDTDRVQISTAPGSDGIVRRIEVRAREASTDWVVFALANSSDDQIDRLIVVPHYQMVGSKILWPDLGMSRVVNITPSAGDKPDLQYSATADIFRITLDPGTVITYVMEMRTNKLPQIYLWEPETYKDKINSFTLYYGIVIGIAGLLALFLTILFVVKGSFMFPAAAALGWAVLVYIGIDFGFWGRVFNMSVEAERVWRASGEAILAATLLVFLFAYLNLYRWHVRYAHVAIAWLAFLGALVAVALVDPSIASGIARLSLLVVALAGFGVVIYLATQGYDRAVLLIPTWLLFVVWVLAAGLAVAGIVTNDIVAPALLGGLVLIVMLIGFTVMQHAFAGGITQGFMSDIERRALALTGSGDMIWDWDVAADKVFTSPETEAALGLKRGSLDGPAAQWVDVVHPLDRDRFRAALDSALEQRRGRIVENFRFRTPDGHSLWFTLKARPVVGSDGEVIRLVGTLTDVTETKITEERLLQDAVHDNLTGLPNRQLFLDRIEAALSFAKTNQDIRPTIIVLDLDRFKQVNDSVGVAVGDSILLTLARRLSRLLKTQDTLARLAGDQFGLILISERDTNRIVGFAEAICKAIRAPITFNEREIFLTASIGLALPEAQPSPAEQLLKDAELAMYVAKRARGDRFEVFKPAMRARKTDRLTLEFGIAAGARPRGDRDSVPAHRAARGSHRGRLRSARALGPSEDGPPVAVGIHHDCRGNRPHQRSWPVRAGTHGASARHLAARRAQPRAAVRECQPVVTPIAQERPDRRPALRTRARRPAPRLAQVGSHRVGCHGKSGAGGVDPGAHQAARRRPRA